MVDKEESFFFFFYSDLLKSEKGFVFFSYSNYAGTYLSRGESVFTHLLVFTWMHDNHSCGLCTASGCSQKLS